jgi:hypothetical protein
LFLALVRFFIGWMRGLIAPNNRRLARAMLWEITLLGILLNS